MFSAGAGRIPVFRNQQCLLEKRACLIAAADPSHSLPDDALLSAVILNRGKNGTYKDKTCYVLSPKTAHSKKCFRPSPCGGKGRRFFDGISIFPALKKRMSFFQTYASEVSCYITLRETSSPERFAQAPAFISFTMPFIRLYSPSMRRRSSIFLVRRSLE